MTIHRLLRFAAGTCLAAGLFAGSLGTATAVTLYDPALATLPSAQGWTTQGTPGYTQSVSGGSYHLDTTAANAVMAGSALVGVPAFNTAAGFELDFGLQIVSETHARVERGGFSVIVTGADPSHALELAFWNDRVFAYTSSFAHGAEALLNTTATTSYALVVGANQYALYGNGNPLLAGALVDYSAAGAPYNQAGLLFFGDDTSSAAASANVGRITVLAAVPEPATLWLLAAGLLPMAWRAGRRRIG